MPILKFVSRWIQGLRKIERLLVLLGATGGLAFSACAQSNQIPLRFAELKLDDYLQGVVRHNETVLAQMLGAEAARRKARAETGIFQPEFNSSLVREANKRENNTQEAAAQDGQLFFSERNTISDTGLQTLLPIGGKVRVGYTLSDLVNNVSPLGFGESSGNQFIKEFQSFFGVTLTQPLLKNGGVASTEAAIRLAAMDSDIAFQQYRRQLMVTISEAESAYWNLYYAQEQLRFFDDSVAVAASVLKDGQEKLKTGQGSDLDVLEAQSGLALSKTKQNEAMQTYYEAVGQVRMLAGASPTGQGGETRAADAPALTNEPVSFYVNITEALADNPDYLVQLKKVEQEKIRVGVAHNQLLPELDLKAAYGFNGLGGNTPSSWDQIHQGTYPSWSVGAELTMPVGENIKGRNDLAAARLNYQKEIQTLNSIESEIANALHTALEKERAWQTNIENYQTVVHFNEELLKTVRQRLSVGVVEPRKVFEAEADLLNSRQSLAQALVALRRAALEAQVVRGTCLSEHGLDLTRAELRERTLALLHDTTGN
jgi:outer membrane protein